MPNPLLYSVDYSITWENALPPEKRVADNLSWGSVLMKCITWLHDLFFITYADGFTGLAWDIATTYAIGDRVKYSDHSVYEALDTIAAAQPAPNINSNWLKIQSNWIGLRERSRYSAQKMTLEYSLNKWFETTFRYSPALSDTYITNNVLDFGGFDVAVSDALSSSVPINEIFSDDSIGIVYGTGQNAFTISIPLAISNALTTEAADASPAISTSRENIVRAFVDKYNTAGITYNIQTY